MKERLILMDYHWMWKVLPREGVQQGVEAYFDLHRTQPSARKVSYLEQMNVCYCIQSPKMH